ncbi:MAG: zinc ribbon domain-containing protein [Emergencia sp.]|jgi:hypothetical protein|nr:zinc ribbon domain-containing protein [Emergencia sp.]
MYCSKCGTKADDDALFCASCGAKLVHIEPAKEEKVIGAETANNLEEAELAQGEIPMDAVAANKAKRFKWLIAAGIVVVILVVFLILKMTSAQGYLGKMPYGINFGESYEQILEKDADAGKPNWNDTQDISTHESLDGTFLGLEKDDLEINLSYALGTDNSLRTITEVIQRTNDSGIPEGELFDTLQERMTKKLGEPETTTLGVQWKNSDGITFELLYFGDDIIFLTISPE